MLQKNVIKEPWETFVPRFNFDSQAKTLKPFVFVIQIFV